MACPVFITYRTQETFYPALELRNQLNADGYDVQLDTMGMYPADPGAQLPDRLAESSDVVCVLDPGTFSEGMNDNDGFSAVVSYALGAGKNVICLTRPGFSWPAYPGTCADRLRGCRCVDAGERSFAETYADLRLLLTKKQSAAAASSSPKKRILPIVLAVLIVLLLGAAFLFLRPVPAPYARGESVSFGYYGDAPLRWTVLDSDAYSTRLISQECIACRPFGSSTDWYRSSLRSWLNDTFLYQAFNDTDRSLMQTVEGDYVRIPSVADMTNPAYGFSTNPDTRDTSRAAPAGPTSIAQGVWVNEDNGRCSYYTMTPHNGGSMKQIRSDGRIGVANISRDDVGVRVIITIDTGAYR